MRKHKELEPSLSSWRQLAIAACLALIGSGCFQSPSEARSTSPGTTAAVGSRQGGSGAGTGVSNAVTSSTGGTASSMGATASSGTTGSSASSATAGSTGASSTGSNGSAGGGSGSAGDAGSGAAWGVPIPVPGVNTSAVQIQAAMTADLLKICFASDRAATGALDVFCATRPTLGDPFGPAAYQTGIATSAEESETSLSADGQTLYFASFRSAGPGSNDLYVASFDPSIGGYASPEPVSIDTSHWESGPGISGDGLTLYFDSDLAGADQDIYVAQRATLSGAWGPSTAVTELNSSALDESPHVSADGSKIVFCSSRTSPSHWKIWVSDWSGSAWTTPRPASIQSLPDVDACGPSVLSNGWLLFHATLPDGGAKIFWAPPL